MDGKNSKQENSGEYIWLRYATRFASGGREHTIEMGVPVPLGADAGTREGLFREAEDGLTHLMSHVESRLPQMLQNAQNAQRKPNYQNTKNAVDSENSVVAARLDMIRQQNANARTTATSTPPTQASAEKTASPSAPKEAATSAPQTATQEFSANARSVHEGGQTAGDGDTEYGEARKSGAQAGGVSMPSMPGSGSGNLTLPEFIQAIKELNLGPRDAMNLLKVKSLTTGINLREALDRLHYLLSSGQDNDDISPREQNALRDIRATANNSQIRQAVATAMQNDDEDDSDLEDDDEQPAVPTPNSKQARPVVFDEEVEPEEEEENFGDASLEDAPALDEESRERASARVDLLREKHGTNTVSQARLQALRNVISGQISEEQVQALIRGVWGVGSLKKLKGEQAEELISWAKDDYFMDDAEAVLIYLDEGE
ncbi:MAG TPA: hypothetical protein VHZ51_05550 [Ktedonobacteraceae bacterium]|nr:hypothetical protein [Ktedonobacteraceae bacterium]